MYALISGTFAGIQAQLVCSARVHVFTVRPNLHEINSMKFKSDWYTAYSKHMEWDEDTTVNFSSHQTSGEDLIGCLLLPNNFLLSYWPISIHVYVHNNSFGFVFILFQMYNSDECQTQSFSSYYVSLAIFPNFLTIMNFWTDKRLFWRTTVMSVRRQLFSCYHVKQSFRFSSL